MFGISIEHLLIVGVVLLLFGPKRLPELGKSLGQSIKNFKDGFNGIEKDSKPVERIANRENEPNKDESKERKS